MVAHDGIEPSFPVGKTDGLPLAECAAKSKSLRFFGGFKDYALLIAPVT